jgi:hypothetical protein
MNKSEILVNVMSKKGQFGRARWRKHLKTRKGVQGIVEKVTCMTIRAGIDYDNMKAVKEKRESGELPAENAGLPWGEWVAFPYLIAHKDKHYLRLYPNGNGKIETQYFLNGSPATMEEISSYVLASELPKGEKPDCITVSLENIEELV